MTKIISKKEIEKIFQKIKKIKNLSPNKETNNFFSKLCNYCQENDTISKEKSVNEKILEINKICAEAEFEMEKFWSEKVWKSKNPEEELKNFPYLKNYIDLTNLEFLNAKFLENNIKNVLFIWSWPLPMSAIILAKDYWVNCTLVDISLEAIELSKILIKNLWLEKYFSFVNSDILTYETEEKFDLVYGASLIFWNDKQEEILKSIKNINFSKLLVRSSHWARKILYKQIDKKLLQKHFKTELVVHPKTDIINSFIILSKK